MKKTQKKVMNGQGCETPADILSDRIGHVQRAREWKLFFLELVLLVVLVYVALTYVVGAVLVRSDSMSPTLKKEEILLFYRLDEEYYSGDIVVIRNTDGSQYVKRIVAVQGDRVDLDAEAGELLVNGEIQEEPYVYTKTYAGQSEVTYPLEIGEGQMFVLGDNREKSLDSRDFGCVTEEQILGRVIFHGGLVF